MRPGHSAAPRPEVSLKLGVLTLADVGRFCFRLGALALLACRFLGAAVRSLLLGGHAGERRVAADCLALRLALGSVERATVRVVKRGLVLEVVEPVWDAVVGRARWKAARSASSRGWLQRSLTLGFRSPGQGFRGRTYGAIPSRTGRRRTRAARTHTVSKRCQASS